MHNPFHPLCDIILSEIRTERDSDLGLRLHIISKYSRREIPSIFSHKDSDEVGVSVVHLDLFAGGGRGGTISI